MIRHIVLIKFQPGVTEQMVTDLFAELHAIQKLVPGVLGITAGRSESPEKIERGYMHGFVADFQDWDTLEAYQSHPAHKALGAKLVANAVGGLDGILVLDIPVAA
jgi:quinol monooxygenase YgiN